MKKNLFTLVLIVVAANLVSLKAQVTIGSNDQPDGNALLDLKNKTDGSADKGLLLPRVALKATNDFSPLTEHVKGMAVYNTAIAGIAPNNVTAGYYYNDGTQWVRLADAATEPWNNVATQAGATSNTQDIYQMGKVGVNLNNPGSTMTVGGSFAADYKTLTASHTLDVTDYYVSYSGATDGTFTLPQAATDGSMLGRMYSIKNVSAFALTINTSNSEKIRNNQATFSSFVMFPGSYCLIVNTGLLGTGAVTWNVVLLSQTTAFALSGTDAIELSAALYNAGTPQVVPFAATDKQVDSGSPGTWNDAGDYFTVEQNGFYEIAAMVHFHAVGGFVTGTPTFQGVNVAVTKKETLSSTATIIGGARGNIEEAIASTGNTPIVVRFIAELKAGNILQLEIFQGYGDYIVSTGNVTITHPNGSIESRYFNIKKL